MNIKFLSFKEIILVHILYNISCYFPKLSRSVCTQTSYSLFSLFLRGCVESFSVPLAKGFFFLLEKLWILKMLSLSLSYAIESFCSDTSVNQIDVNKDQPRRVQLVQKWETIKKNPAGQLVQYLHSAKKYIKNTQSEHRISHLFHLGVNVSAL